MIDLDMTATDPKQTPYSCLNGNHYQLEETDSGAVLRLHRDGVRKNAFITLDPTLARQKGVEVYTRLNIPDEDRERLVEWLGISELKHT